MCGAQRHLHQAAIRPVDPLSELLPWLVTAWPIHVLIFPVAELMIIRLGIWM
jgi:hypothetical protein